MNYCEKQHDEEVTGAARLYRVASGGAQGYLRSCTLFNKPKKQVASAMLRERPRAERSRSPTSPAAISGQN
jgi:hypothetical protein